MVSADIGGQHGRRFGFLRHTHRPQRRPYLICTNRSGNALPNTVAEAVKLHLDSFWEVTPGSWVPVPRGLL